MLAKDVFNEWNHINSKTETKLNKIEFKMKIFAFFLV